MYSNTNSFFVCARLDNLKQYLDAVQWDPKNVTITVVMVTIDNVRVHILMIRIPR